MKTKIYLTLFFTLAWGALWWAQANQDVETVHPAGPFSCGGIYCGLWHVRYTGPEIVVTASRSKPNADGSAEGGSSSSSSSGSSSGGGNANLPNFGNSWNSAVFGNGNAQSARGGGSGSGRAQYGYVYTQQYMDKMSAETLFGGIRTMDVEIAPTYGWNLKGGFPGYTRSYNKTTKQWNQKHEGFDIKAKVGTPLKSLHHGTVVKLVSEDTGSFGKYVIISFEYNGKIYYVLYAHLSEVLVGLGDIKAGDLIGKTGITGNAKHPSVIPHLHIEYSADLNRAIRINPNTGKPFTRNDNGNNLDNQAFPLFPIRFDPNTGKVIDFQDGALSPTNDFDGQ